MRHLKFICSALAILLAGAMAAGFAARAVAAPRTGETVSAGVVSIPSVLGQTAEEVLFYPWSLYETLTLEPLTPLLEMEDEEQAVKEMAESFAYRYFAPFSLFDVELDELAAYGAARYAYISRSQGTLMFLKDFRAQAGDGTPLVLSFAHSVLDPASISYLIRPQNSVPVTEERQEQALDRVKADLWELLTSQDLLDAAITSQAEREEVYALFIEGDSAYITPSGEVVTIDNAMAGLLAGYYVLSWSRSLDSRPIPLIWQHLKEAGDLYGFTAETPLDDVLDSLDKLGMQIQLVSTPDQVIALFTYGSNMMGVYYDVQLECYSGIGLNG